MPRGDRTGPDGAGQRTGRGLGNCVDKNKETNNTSTGFGRGNGRGFANKKNSSNQTNRKG